MYTTHEKTNLCSFWLKRGQVKPCLALQLINRQKWQNSHEFDDAPSYDFQIGPGDYWQHHWLLFYPPRLEDPQKHVLFFAAPSFLNPSNTFSLVSRYHVPFIREKYGWGADNLMSFMTYYSTACISLVMYKKFAWLSKTMIPGLLGTPNSNGPWITLLEIECSPGFISTGTYQVTNLWPLWATFHCSNNAFLNVTLCHS